MPEVARLAAGKLTEQQRLDAVNSVKIGNADIQERYDRITRIAQKMFNVSMADFSLIKKDDQCIVSSTGLIDSTIPRDISFAEYSLHKNDVFFVVDAQLDSRFSTNPQVSSRLNIRFFATCPVHTKHGERIGALTIAHTSPRTFSAHDQSVLKDLAGMIETELSFASIITVDHTTNMPMNQGFYALAEQSLKVCQRNKTPAVAIVFDVANKHAVNQGGLKDDRDHNVKAFADQLRNFFRKSDVVGRLDNEEFTALLLNAKSEQVTEMVKKLQTSIDAYNSEHVSQAPLRFTHSIAEFDPEHPTRPDALVAQATQAVKKAVGF
jgi:diguanylate cyclase (GGDEF)-like protein